MSDHLTKEQRHKNMAAIRSKDTKPEMIVRHGLWKRGFRYRLNYKRLPGHPDLVLKTLYIKLFKCGYSVEYQCKRLWCKNHEQQNSNILGHLWAV